MSWKAKKAFKSQYTCDYVHIFSSHTVHSTAAIDGAINCTLRVGSSRIFVYVMWYTLGVYVM